LSYLKIVDPWYGLLQYLARYGLIGLARLESRSDLHFAAGCVKVLRQQIEQA
jgi:hypothetical protein